MDQKVETQIRTIFEISDQLVGISEQGLLSCEDDGCVLLHWKVREYACRLRNAAERERKSRLTEEDRHQMKQ